MLSAPITLLMLLIEKNPIIFQWLLNSSKKKKHNCYRSSFTALTQKRNTVVAIVAGISVDVERLVRSRGRVVRLRASETGL